MSSAMGATEPSGFRGDVRRPRGPRGLSHTRPKETSPDVAAYRGPNSECRGRREETSGGAGPFPRASEETSPDVAAYREPFPNVGGDVRRPRGHRAFPTRVRRNVS